MNLEVSTGIGEWARNIHNRLQNDPTRAAFKELVQVQGFLFLDEYLEEVFKGPKDQPVIELAKTPGRRKETQKRTRAAVAAVAANATKMKAINDKENVVPVESTFQKALLRAKAEDEKVKTPSADRVPLGPSKVAFAAPLQTKNSDDRKPSPLTPSETSFNSNTPTQRNITSQLSARQTSTRPIQQAALILDDQVDAPPPDLSIIQEDEEVERAIALRGHSVTPTMPNPDLFAQEAMEADDILSNERLSGPSVADSADSWTTALSTQSSAPSGTNKDTAAAASRAPSVRPLSSNKPANAHPRSFPSLAPRSPASNKNIPSSLPRSPTVISKIPRSPKVASFPNSIQRSSPIPHSKLASTSLGDIAPAHKKPDSTHQPVQVQVASIPSRPSAAAVNPLPGGPKMRSSWLTRAVADQGSQVSLQPKKSLGAVLAAQAKKSMGVSSHPGSTSSNGLKRKSEVEDDEVRDGDHRKSKVLKASYGGGVLARSEEEPITSKPVSQSAKVPAPIAPTDIIVPISQEEDELEEDEYDDDDDEEGGEELTSFDRLRETVGKFKEQRAKSIHHIDITERFNVNVKHLEDEDPEHVVPSADQASYVAQSSTTSVSQVVSVSTSNEARPTSLSNVSASSQTRLSLSELVSSRDSVPKMQEANEKTALFARHVAAMEPASFNLLKDSVASTTPPNSPPKPHVASKNNSFATAQQAKLTTKMAREIQQAVDATSTSSKESSKSSTWDDMMSLMNPPPPTSAAPAPPAAIPQSIFFQQPELPRSPSPIAAKTLVNNPFIDKPLPNPPSNTATFKVPANLFSAGPSAPSIASQPSFTTELSSQPSTLQDSIFSSTQTDSQAAMYQEVGSFNDVFTQPKAASNAQVKEQVSSRSLSRKEEPEMDEFEDAEMGDEDEDVDMIEEIQQSPQRGLPATPSGMASSFLGTAANLVAKAFGSSKSKKGDTLKSLQAAAAAKAEQEEKEREKAKKKEQMEQRRIMASQKKFGSERAKQAEAEKKKRDEVEKKKRERDEMNTSKLGKGKKNEEEEPAKKRKITVEAGKKPELKRQPSKDKLNASYQAGTAVAAATTSNIARVNNSRPASQQSNYTAVPVTAKPAAKKGTATVVSSQAAGPSFTKLPQNPSQAVASSSAANGGVKIVGQNNQNGWSAPSNSSKPATSTPKQLHRASKASLNGKQPSQAVHAQMQARIAAQLGKDKEKEEAIAASEQIELPDINSEYSDSEDEDRGKDLPDWAQSPELADALRTQRSFNPEELFGPIGPLKMEEIFKTRHSRFRSRTSSANWNGTDRLTEMEELEYARRMGFH